MSDSRTELFDEFIRIDVARKKVFPYLIGVDAPHAKVGVKGMFRRCAEAKLRSAPVPLTQ
jgi:hypothetical protein